LKPKSGKTSFRCAIYTRVSTEHGLEQEFNSLDAQREASEAYIKSQAQEGWQLIRNRYNDGGFSGGSMERPALKKLLEDVRAKRVDVIVVYKVDRLTRSLVTQSFNTTTSMGRLTLNVLLSFAQFEREVTGERIRDKIAASKKKGIWMGGVVPLGYRVENRALHGVEEHAEFVRDLFRRYLKVGSVVRLKAILDQENVRLPMRTDGTGKTTGGGLISRGHLYKILSNPVYVGQLTHKGAIHDGLHDPIVDGETWNQVQSLLVEHAQHKNVARQDSDALLAGKVFDDRGNRMSPSHAAKGGRRWRYYVSQAILQGRKQDAGSVARVAAGEIERRVCEAVRDVLSVSDRQRAIGSQSGQRHTSRLMPWAGFPAQHEAEPRAATESGDVRAAVQRVMITRTTIEIELREAVAGEDQHPTLIVPWTPPSPYRRREIIQGEGDRPSAMRPMRTIARAIVIDALRDAHRWLDELTMNSDQTIEALASREGKTERSIRMTLSLTFLSPTLAKAAIDGRLPRGFGTKRLMDLPMAWPDQWSALGLKPSPQA
jgi:DNA invertase Pin-like site-specific DNA recombinase